MTAEIFNFDDFFVSDDDAGMAVDVEINGRTVPLVLKRSLTLGDIEACKAHAIKTRLNHLGVPEVVSVDDNEFTIQILLRAIQSWPFTFPDGTPVPVTRKILEKMMSEGAIALQQLVLNMVSSRKEVHLPFVPPSDEA